MTQEKQQSKPKKRGRSKMGFKKEWCDKLEAHMTEGLSFESFAGKIEVGRSTLYAFLKRRIDFANAKKRAEQKSLFFWEQLGLAGARGDASFFDAAGKEHLVAHYNATSWIFTMKNRFKWTDHEQGKEPNDHPKLIRVTIIDGRKKK